jgi:hypothetical protein
MQSVVFNRAQQFGYFIFVGRANSCSGVCVSLERLILLHFGIFRIFLTKQLELLRPVLESLLPASKKSIILLNFYKNVSNHFKH